MLIVILTKLNNVVRAKRSHTSHCAFPFSVTSLASIWQWYFALFSLIFVCMSCLLWQLIVRVQKCALSATPDIYPLYTPLHLLPPPSVLAVAWVMRLLPLPRLLANSLSLSHVFHRRIIAACSLFAGDLHMLISHGSFSLTNVALLYVGILMGVALCVLCVEAYLSFA